MKQCPKCKAMLEDDELFCHECGTKQEIEEVADQVEETTAPPVKKCIHCGETIEEDCAFCPYCGKPQEVETKEAEPQIEGLKPEEEPVVEEKHEPEEKAAVKEIPVQEEPEEQPMYIEEEEKSKTWLYVLLAVLIGGAIWYFFLNDSGKTTSEDIDQTTPIEQTNNVPVENEEEGDAPAPTSELAFLEQFYKGNLNDADFIKQHVTANVLNKLKRDFGNDCPSGNCIATWVFTAYPPDSDLFLEQGPIITKDKEAGKYSVVYRYYSQVQGGRIYKPRGLLLSVTEIDGKYLISDYELAMPDIVQNQDDLSNNSDGQYYLRDGRLFLHLIKEGQKIEADFNFRDGTYVSATYDFSCIINNENKFCTDVYKNGKKMGMIEGTFENGVMKVDVGVDNKYSGSYELKVNQNE